MKDKELARSRGSRKGVVGFVAQQYQPRPVPCPCSVLVLFHQLPPPLCVCVFFLQSWAEDIMAIVQNPLTYNASRYTFLEKM